MVEVEEEEGRKQEREGRNGSGCDRYFRRSRRGRGDCHSLLRRCERHGLRERRDHRFHHGGRGGRRRDGRLGLKVMVM